MCAASLHSQRAAHFCDYWSQSPIMMQFSPAPKSTGLPTTERLDGSKGPFMCKCVCMCTSICMSWVLGEGQRTILRSQSSPTILWDLGIKFKLSGLHASVSTSIGWTILLAQWVRYGFILRRLNPLSDQGPLITHPFHKTLHLAVMRLFLFFIRKSYWKVILNGGGKGELAREEE